MTRLFTLHGWTGSRIRALRTHLGLTQEDLATQIGCSRVSVSGWETDTHPVTITALIRRLDDLAQESGFGTRDGS